jgi:hypothetical protein
LPAWPRWWRLIRSTPNCASRSTARVAADAAKIADSTVIVVEPVGEFVTYGVGVSLMEMRDTVKARGRAPVRP